MLTSVLKRVLSFSAITALAFAILMVDLDSPSLISEAYACDQQLYESCGASCMMACAWGNIPECNPNHGTGCDCAAYCEAVCLDWSGCG